MRRLIRRSSYQGFTLMEMLLAAALAALLMTAMLQVMMAVTRSTSQLNIHSPEESWQRQLRSILERDLAHTCRCRFIDGQLQLEGPLALDAQGRAIHLPAAVAYRIVESSSSDGMAAWVRIERTPGAAGKRPSRVDALVWDVRQVRLKVVEPGEVSDRIISRPSDLTQWCDVPPMLSLSLFATDDLTPQAQPGWTWRLHGR